MAARSWIPTVVFIAVAATPAFGQDGHHRRATQEREQPRQEQPAQQPQQAAPQTRDRAVPRTVEPRRDQQVRQDQVRRDDQARRQDQGRRQYNGAQDNGGRTYARQDDARQYGVGGYGRYEARPSYSRSRGYAPRIVRPTIIQVAPYRPYIYRPSWSNGVYYGSGGYYPYG